MVFSNLSGTTGKEFSVGNDGGGRMYSMNTYDLWWKAYNENKTNPNVHQISNGGDLNNYTIPGQYYCSQNDAVSKLLNCPTTVGFIMETFPATGDDISKPTQRITNQLGEMYIRTYHDNWSDWNKIAYESSSSSALTQEVGEWFPTVQGTVSIQQTNAFLNSYIKTGSLCVVTCSLTLKSNADSNGSIVIKGLPFSPRRSWTLAVASVPSYGVIDVVSSAKIAVPDGRTLLGYSVALTDTGYIIPSFNTLQPSTGRIFSDNLGSYIADFSILDIYITMPYIVEEEY